MVQYIVNDEGRKAVDDIYIPQLGTRNKKNQSDIFGLNALLIALQIGLK